MVTSDQKLSFSQEFDNARYCCPIQSIASFECMLILFNRKADDFRCTSYHSNGDKEHPLKFLKACTERQNIFQSWNENIGNTPSLHEINVNLVLCTKEEFLY